MKYYIFAFFTFVTMFCAGQVLEEKVDEFTKVKVVNTSWTELIGGGPMSSLCTNFRLLSVDSGVFFLELKMMLGGKVFAIAKGNPIMFLFEDGSTVSFENLNYEVACKGCGAVGFSGSEAYGTSTNYRVNLVAIETLSKKKPTKVRVYTSEGYVEREVKAKNAEKINKSFTLFFNKFK